MTHRHADREDHMWWSVTTVEQYGELTAQWLEGKIVRLAATISPIIEETRPIAATLAAVNRWGYITDWSQPARKNTDPLPPLPPRHSPQHSPFFPWQRATVTGFATEAKTKVLVRAAEAAGLDVIVHVPNSPPIGFAKAVAVSRKGDKPVLGETAAGYQQTREELCRWIESRVVANALADIYQVIIVDRDWGRNDRLWPMLDRLTGRKA